MTRDYTLGVKDFGPIAEAQIELRPMTVFVGPSNTGKSYFATLVYALHRCLRDPRKFVELGNWKAPHFHQNWFSSRVRCWTNFAGLFRAGCCTLLVLRWLR